MNTNPTETRLNDLYDEQIAADRLNPETITYQQQAIGLIERNLDDLKKRFPAGHIGHFEVAYDPVNVVYWGEIGPFAVSNEEILGMLEREISRRDSVGS